MGSGEAYRQLEKAEARTQRTPKQEGKGVDCEAVLEAKPDRGGGGGDRSRSRETSFSRLFSTAAAASGGAR